MNKKHENRLGMIETTINYCQGHPVITESLPAFSTNFEALQAILGQIHLEVEGQAADGSGATTSKTSLRQDLVRLGADTARKLVAFATISKNKTLLNEINYSESDLLHLPDTVLPDTCQMIHNRAQAHLAALADYLVTGDTQAALQEAIDAYKGALSAPRLKQVKQSQASKQLYKLFAQADKALANMDAVVEIVRLAEPAFYSGYKLARTIIDNAGKKMALKALVSDAQNTLPLQGVAVSFWANGDSAPDTVRPALMVKKTAEKGGFYVKSLAPGSYLVELKKAGYAPQNLTIYINDGEMTVLEAAMQAL
jgi:hypothetical protein